MTIGATTTFQQSRDEICTDALVNLGAVAPGKDASAARTAGLLTHAGRALNRLVKSMDADGQLLWRVVRRTAGLGSGENNFDAAADVLDIDEPMRCTKNGETDSTPIMSMSRDEWMTIADRTQQGTPNRYFAERTLANLTVYVFPTNDTAATSIEYAAYTKVADFNSGAETPDFMQSWSACLVYGLTAELAASYGQPQKIQIFRDLFQEEKARLLGNDNERGRLILVPFGACG